jgi:uncharacterized protein (TIRG00374 family)
MDRMSGLGAFNRRRLLLIGLIGFASVAVLVGLAGGRAAFAAIAGANWTILGVALAVHYSSFALRGQRWQRLLAALAYPLPYSYVTSLLLAGWFTSALLPARAGDLLRVGVLRLDTTRHAPVPVAASLSSIVLERVLDILSILLLGAAFGFALLRDQIPDWLLGSYLVGILLLLSFGGGLVLAPPFLVWLRRLSAHRFWQMGLDFVGHFVMGLRTLFRQPATAAVVIVVSLFIWLCDALVLWLVALSLHAPLPLPAAAFVALTVDVLAAIPLTPGGVGQIDAAYAALLALLTLPGAQVGAVVLLVRFITYWSFLAFSGLVTALSGFGALLPSALAAGGGSLAPQKTETQSSPTVAHTVATSVPPPPVSTITNPAGEDACAPTV